MPPARRPPSSSRNSPTYDEIAAGNPVSKEVLVARTSVFILAPWNPLSLCAYGESHKEFK